MRGRLFDISDAEHAENEFRKSLTLSEKAELAELIKGEKGRPVGKPRGHKKISAQNGKISSDDGKIGVDKIAIEAGLSCGVEFLLYLPDVRLPVECWFVVFVVG